VTRSTTSSPSWAEAEGTDTLSHLGDRLGYSFADPDLLALALTHRSWCAENAGQESNERLEFLGDAVLGLVVTDYVFARYPHLPEGEMAKIRASVVNAGTLAEVAGPLGLGDHLRLGKGEHASGGRAKPSLLADALEAVIGAIYVEGGYEPARDLVLNVLTDRIAEAAEGPGVNDFKTQLQELAARRYEQLPQYGVRDEGPDHAKRFFATVRLGGEIKGEGEGRSKKQAEQAAAQAAWGRVMSELGDRPVGGDRA
jgi:ribonuclease-3